MTGATQDPTGDNACNCPTDTYLDETGTTPQCTACPTGSSTNSTRGATSCSKNHSINMPFPALNYIYFVIL